MKNNRKIILWSVLASAIIVIALLCDNRAEAYGSTSEWFRVNMQFSFSPNTPGQPAPIYPPKYWVDVGNWQIYLKTHGESLYLGAAYPNNNFDFNTEMATKDWQGRNGLPATGVVTAATIAKAKSLGMPNYPTKSTKAEETSPLSAAGKPNDESGDKFRVPMGIPYNPSGPSDPPDDAFWNDVFHWQEFLKRWESYQIEELKQPLTRYMGSAYPNGNFDPTTQSATIQFQKAAEKAATPIESGYVPGHVDEKTFNRATIGGELDSFSKSPMPQYPLIRDHKPPPDPPSSN